MSLTVFDCSYVNAKSVSFAGCICETVNLNGWATTGERVPRNGDCISYVTTSEWIHPIPVEVAKGFEEEF